MKITNMNNELKNEVVDEKMELYRSCNNCNEQYDFYTIKDRFPVAGQEQLKTYWQNQNVEFYCSACYFHKLIKQLNDKKKL